LQKPLKSFLPLEGLLYATVVVNVVTSNPCFHFSRLRDQRLRRSCQDKLHLALDLWQGIGLHSISGDNNDLFLPIRIVNPRRTNKGATRRSHIGLKATNFIRSCLF
jgi:hypothetical protein